MNIYDRIKKLCSEKHIDVQELETELGYTRGHLYKWSNSFPRLDKLLPIADYFNVSIDYLVGRDVKYSDEQALLDVEISEDFELKEAIKKYYTLDDRKKKHIIELINILSEV